MQGRGHACPGVQHGLLSREHPWTLDTMTVVLDSQSLRRGCWWQRCEPRSDSRNILDAGPWDLLGHCPWEGVREINTEQDTLVF